MRKVTGESLVPLLNRVLPRDWHVTAIEFGSRQDLPRRWGAVARGWHLTLSGFQPSRDRLDLWLLAREDNAAPGGTLAVDGWFRSGAAELTAIFRLIE